MSQDLVVGLVNAFWQNASSSTSSRLAVSVAGNGSQKIGSSSLAGVQGVQLLIGFSNR